MGAAQPWAARASLTPRAPSTAFTTGELPAQLRGAQLPSGPSSAPPHPPPPPAATSSLHPPHAWLCPLLRGSPCSPQARPQGGPEPVASVTPVSSYPAPVLQHPEPLGVPYVLIYLWGHVGCVGDSASKLLFTDTGFEGNVPPAPLGCPSL